MTILLFYSEANMVFQVLFESGVMSCVVVALLYIHMALLNYVPRISFLIYSG